MKWRHIAKMILVAATCCSPISGIGEIALSAEFENVTYLKLESMPVTVTLRNDTGEALVLGGPEEGSPQLDFEVRRDDKTLARATEGRMVESVVILLPGRPKKIVVDVSDHYVMQAVGRYHVSAVVRMKKTRYVSKSVVVEVVPGIEVLKVERPVAGYEGARRTYSLRSWRRDGTDQLFLSIYDKAQRQSHGVFSLGPLLLLMEPAIAVGTSGFVTVKHQSGAVSVSRTTFKSSRDGVMFVKQTTEAIKKPKAHTMKDKAQTDKKE